MPDQPGNPWLAGAGDRGAAYQRRLEEKAAAGEYLHAEADLVQAWLAAGAAPGGGCGCTPADPGAEAGPGGGCGCTPVADPTAARQGSVLDAGCGTGRVAVELAARGLEVVGADVDPTMLAVAQASAAPVRWVQADLAELDLGRTFDVVLAAGNVVIFLTPGTGPAVVRRLAAHTAPGGVLIAGFALDGGPGGEVVALADYDAWCAAAGLELADRRATWEGEPYAGGPYAVSVHRRP